MSKIVVYSMAHRGDVFPYVPIAAELGRRGHDVRFVTPREFHPLLRAEPFRAVHSGTDFGPSSLDQHGAYLARWGMRLGGSMLLRLYFGEYTLPHLDVLFESIDAEVADADLVVAHPAASLVAAMSCERRDVPWVVGDLFPMLVPSERTPPAGVPNLGPRATRWIWSLSRSRLAGRSAGAEGFLAFRRRLGLRTDGWNLLDARLSPHLNLALSSPSYVTAQPDWPADYRLTGFTPWQGPDAGAIPADVVSFLAAGEAPVVVTLGSSAASARPELFEAVARVLVKLGVRGLHLTSNEAIAERTRNAVPDESQGVWPFVPLAPLLPHARAIVHSGAHGTNALALGAGVPSAIVPCLFDQLWNARRQEQLGTGVHVHGTGQLEAAVVALAGNASIRDRARTLGATIAAENGTVVAVDAIEGFLRSM